MLQLYFLPWKQTQDFKRICHVLCSYVTGYQLQLASVPYDYPEIKKTETNEY